MHNADLTMKDADLTMRHGDLTMIGDFDLNRGDSSIKMVIQPLDMVVY